MAIRIHLVANRFPLATLATAAVGFGIGARRLGLVSDNLELRVEIDVGLSAVGQCHLDLSLNVASVVVSRQHHLDASTAERRSGYRYRSVVRADNFVDDGQAQAAAAVIARP